MRDLVLMTTLTISMACNGDQTDSGDSMDDAFAPMEGTWSCTMEAVNRTSVVLKP